MPDNGNGDWLPKPVIIGLWSYTGLIILALLGLVLFNPDGALGESQAVILGWFQKYPGQSTALQLLGAFIVTMGIMPYLLEQRLSSSLPLIVRITALAGASVTMGGLVIHDIPENYLAMAILGALMVFVAPAWILAVTGAWLKSRRKPGG